MLLKDEILNKFKNPDKYKLNPIFDSMVNSLKYGTSPYHLIEDLIEVIETYQKEKLEHIKSATTQTIIVSKEIYESIRNIDETNKSWNDFINEFKKIGNELQNNNG